MMNKEKIILEIQRAASENGGVAPGQESFERTTGISAGKWRGKYWRNWGDAVAEAGFAKNKLNEAYETPFLLSCLATLSRKLQRFPTYADLRLEREANKSFPAHQVFNRLGSRDERIALLRKHANAQVEFSDILVILPNEESKSDEGMVAGDSEAISTDGFVYMIKFNKHYKIGKTFAVPRRHREISLELPEKPDVVHAIRTDDPMGIEAYWHTRFESKRANGEWFSLSRDDIQAFKRRKFM